MKLRISDVIYGPGDTLILSFEVLDERQPTYLAGQFLTLVFNVRGREVRRSYSLCSAPNLDEPLSIAIKKIENGEISPFSIFFMAMESGSPRFGALHKE